MSGTDSIGDMLLEIAKLEQEKKELNGKLRGIRLKQKMLKERVVKFLDDNDENGLVHKGITFERTENKRRTRVKKEDKNKAILKTLKNAGVEDPEAVLQQIENAGKGQQEHIPNLSIKNLAALEYIQV